MVTETVLTHKRINAGCPWYCEGYLCVDIAPLDPRVRKAEICEFLSTLPDDSLEEIKAECLLDHLLNPQIFLDLAYKKLKTGGVINLVVDNAEWFFFYFPYFKNRWGIGAHNTNQYVIDYEMRRGMLHESHFSLDHGINHPSVHYSIFSPLHIKNRLVQAGFKNIKVRRILFGARLKCEAQKLP
jgi:hypothetical protein